MPRLIWVFAGRTSILLALSWGGSLKIICTSGSHWIWIRLKIGVWNGPWKTCVMSYANNKGADQPAHPRRLISAFVVRCLDSIMSLISETKISSLVLASVAEQASLSLTWSETPEDTFSHDEAHSLIDVYVHNVDKRKRIVPLNTIIPDLQQYCVSKKGSRKIVTDYKLPAFVW